VTRWGRRILNDVADALQIRRGAITHRLCWLAVTNASVNEVSLA
jgi:hypothetical protein